MSLSTLCQQCGLCCNGALFTFLPVEPDELERTRALGVKLEARRDGRTAMLLPCRVLKGTCCGVYEQRPARCREYVCELGKALQSGGRPIDAALTIVGEARRQLSELEALLGPKAAGDERGTLQRAQQLEASEPDDARWKAVRAAARALDAMLRQYFVGR